MMTGSQFYKFQSDRYTYEDLVEREFLDNIYEYLRQELGSKIDEYEFILYSSNRNDNPPIPIVLTGEKKKILIYISDETASTPLHLCKYFWAIFKSYLPNDDYIDRYLFPFPLGYMRGLKQLPIVPIGDREFNIFFSGNLNTKRYGLHRSLYKMNSILGLLPAISQRIDKKIDKIVREDFKQIDFSNKFPNSYIRFTNGFMKGLDVTTYGNMLYNSKIVICPRGYDRSETFRHFEAMRAGCIIISEPLPKTRLYRGSPIIELETWTDLQKTVKELLNSPTRLNELHQQTLDWWNNVCSEKATAMYIKEQLLRSEIRTTSANAELKIKNESHCY